MIKEAIKELTQEKNLSSELMLSSMSEIMEGVATPAQIASFLTALKMKTETPQEISVGAKVMRAKAISFIPQVSKLIDTCGTGGDGLHTFNISTLVAFALSTYGIPVAKHGNRSVSSSCGSADLMESLGLPLIREKEIIKRAIEEISFGYIFAPYYHPAMKYATPVRREIGVRTMFNILGPLANPAQPDYQIIGVYAGELLDTIANAMKDLGLKSALIVHAQDGMDEISLSSTTEARFLKNGSIEKIIIEPQEYGLKKENLDVFKVRDQKEGVKKAWKVIQGKSGPELEIVAFNSGWALYILDEVTDPREGYMEVKKLFQSGAVFKKFNQIRDYFSHVTS